jgi:DNA-binding transcriptional ArsR family regulator
LPRIPKSPSATAAQASAALFAALGDRQRLWLVSRLCHGGPGSITQLASGARITRQAVTKHLRVMEHAGLVRSARRGRERVWQLEQRQLEEARRYLSQISAEWDAVLEKLRAFVEE